MPVCHPGPETSCQRASYQLFHGTSYLLSEVPNFLLDIDKAHTFCIPNDRGHQTFRGRDCHAKIDVVVVDKLVALSDFSRLHRTESRALDKRTYLDVGIRRRDLLKGKTGCLGECTHEAEFHVMRLQDLVLVLLPERHKCRHVDFIERRQ